MKNNFIRKFYAPPGFDGGGIGAGVGAAASSTPYAQIAQSGLGALQAVLGFVQAKRAQKQLEKLQSPTYAQNQSILDFYNKALQRYGVDPTESALYKRNQKNIQRSTAQGVGMLQDRRAGQSGIPSLIRAQNDALLNTEVAAENERNSRFRELGTATGMKASEDRTAFDINQQQPFERRYNLLAMKAGAGASMANAGLSNIFGGLNTQQQLDMIKKTYGT